MKIISNKARCKVCSDVIESKHEHDFKRCLCGKIAVDGGLLYLKRLGLTDDIDDLSETDNEMRLDDKQIVLLNWMYNFCLVHMLSDRDKFEENDKQLLAEAIQRRFPDEAAAVLESTLYLPKHP